MFVVIALSLVLFSGIALWFVRQGKSRIALTALAAAMVPIGFSMMDGVARMAPFFSLADAAALIREKSAPNEKVVYEGSMHVGSSLLFYLGRRFYLVNQDPASEPGATLPEAPDIFLDENEVLQEWQKPERIYLFVEHQRIPHWRALLEGEGLQVMELTTCGTTTLLSNRP
jgi:hypothetical protein